MSEKISHQNSANWFIGLVLIGLVFLNAYFGNCGVTLNFVSSAIVSDYTTIVLFKVSDLGVIDSDCASSKNWDHEAHLKHQVALDAYNSHSASAVNSLLAHCINISDTFELKTLLCLYPLQSTATYTSHPCQGGSADEHNLSSCLKISLGHVKYALSMIKRREHVNIVFCNHLNVRDSLSSTLSDSPTSVDTSNLNSGGSQTLDSSSDENSHYLFHMRKYY